METKVLHEITPLDEHDFMYVADRHKKEFTYPIHCHELIELNFVEHAAGCRRVMGDSSEVIGDYDLVLITSPQLEHVWEEQHECHSEDIHEVTIQFRLNFEDEQSPFKTNPYSSIYKMLMRVGSKSVKVYKCTSEQSRASAINTGETRDFGKSERSIMHYAL